MKYRRLTREEFEELHEEFILFLSSNTITGDDWKKIKEETPEKAEELMDIFSDIAFEKVLTQANYLERKSSTEYMSAHFGEQQAEMILLRAKQGEIPAKLTSDDIKKALETKAFELYSGKKQYSKLREQEMFSLMQQGASLSDGNLFVQLKELL